MKLYLIVAVALMGAGSADAALVNQTIYLDATNFHPYDETLTTTPPYSEVSGIFSLTYDDAVNGQAELSVSNFTLPITDLQAYYIAGGTPQLTIYNAGGFFAPGGGFRIILEEGDDPYLNGAVNYSVDGVIFDNAFTPTDMTNHTALRVVTTLAVSEAPEPASWVMMVGGFGLLGAAVRRKKTSVSFA